jgi:hypothetical protein
LSGYSLLNTHGTSASSIYTIVNTAANDGENVLGVVVPTVFSRMVIKIVMTGWIGILDSILGGAP